MTTLQALYRTLAQAQHDGSLTLAAGSAGAPVLDGFLATLPSRSLALRRPQLRLADSRLPATLTVSGTMDATWPLPGLTGAGLSLRAATVTYQQNGPAAPVTVSLTVIATLPAGQEMISLDGTLGDGSVVGFEWSQGPGGHLSLADAAALATDGRAVSWLPAGVPALDSLQLSSLSLSLGYTPGSTTTMEFGFAARPHAAWEILPGQALRQIGVTLAAAYRTSPGSGARRSFGGSIHATLDLGQRVDVVIGLTPGALWELELTGSAGLPALGTIAAIAGAQAEVRNGLAGLKLSDITLLSARLGVSRDRGSLVFLTMQGTMPVAGKAIHVYAQLPRFTLGGSLPEGTPVSLTGLLESTLGDAGGLPGVPSGSDPPRVKRGSWA